jgi:hypothetical protein
MTEYIRYGKWLIEVVTAKPAGWHFTVKLDLVKPSNNHIVPIDVAVGLFLDREEGCDCCRSLIDFCFEEQGRAIVEAITQYLTVRKEMPEFVEMLERKRKNTEKDLDLDR